MSIHDNFGESGSAILHENSWVIIHDSEIFANQSSSGGILHSAIYTGVSHWGVLEMWNTEVHDNIGRAISASALEMHGCRIADNVGGGAPISFRDHDMAHRVPLEDVGACG